MNRLRKARTPLRTKITRLSSQVKTLLNEDDVDTKALKIKLMSLDSTWREMEEVNTKIKTQLLDDDATEEDIQAEYDDMEYYEETYHTLRQDIVNELQKHVSPAPSSTAASESVSGEKKRQYKLPKIELMKFDGELKSWLAWWSQYKKIHEDDELDDSDKFQYLCQSIKADTEAKEIVMSYPLSADNYDKAVKALQERFGRDDLQLQYYVRELLSLVISNVTKKDKLPLSSLYLKLDSQLRSLATLKLDEADPATWLFPLVESSLSKETLRAWQRSPLSKEISDSTSAKKTRLEYLMEFIKAEVRTEQQIAMAQTAFQSTTIDMDINTEGKARSATRIFGEEEIATAAGLLSTQTSPVCVFCEGKHDGDRCVSAQSLTLAERTEKVKQQRLCFRCLRPGHHSAKCKTIVKCIICQGRHFPIMCRGRKDEKQEVRVPPRTTETETQHDPALVGAQSDNFSPSFYSASKPFTPGYSTSSAANHCSGDVMLNTFKVRLVGPHSSMIVRVVGDTGSQRSYIRRDVVRKMGCQRIGEEQIQNVLFGNYVTPPTIHHKYSARLHNVNGTNWGTYDFLERDEICGNLPQIPQGPWIDELQQAGIQLSDVGSSCDVIDILIGSDKWGSILTGNMVKLNCGLVAIETILGWTVSGKLPRIASNLAATVTSLLCTSNDISQPWSLETKGITDSLKSKTVEEQELEATQQFKKNLSYDGGNRVADIVRCESPCQWHHVSGHLNQADLPSRSCGPSEIVQSTWWEGPSWLNREQPSWPYPEEEVDEDSVNIERKKCATSAVTKTVEFPPFSSYRENVANVARVLRFIKTKSNWPKLDSLPNPKKNYVTVGKLRAAEKVVLRQVQKKMFPKMTGGMPETVDANSLCRGYFKMKSLQQQRFRKEYLYLLIQHWKERGKPEIKVGDVVLVGSDNKKRYEWPLGIVKELLPGKDGETRTAKIRTTDNILLRPLQRLYPLEISASENLFVSPNQKPVKATRQKKEKVSEKNVLCVTKRGRVVKQPARYGQWLHLVSNY